MTTTLTRSDTTAAAARRPITVRAARWSAHHPWRAVALWLLFVTACDRVGGDLSAAATYSLPVTLVIMLIAFGAIIAAGVPVLLALSAVGAATGLSALVSHVVPDAGTTSSMILLMGMAVGVDYSLFYV